MPHVSDINRRGCCICVVLLLNRRRRFKINPSQLPRLFWCRRVEAGFIINLSLKNATNMWWKLELSQLECPMISVMWALESFDPWGWLCPMPCFWESNPSGGIISMGSLNQVEWSSTCKQLATYTLTGSSIRIQERLARDPDQVCPPKSSRWAGDQVKEWR
jgi:hypothetical protein